MVLICLSRILKISACWPTRCLEHRVSQLEEYFRCEVQLPYYFRANQQLKHINEDIFQMLLEHWVVQGTNHLSRKPAPVSDHPSGTEMFPNAQSYPPLVQLCAVPTLPSVPRSRAQHLLQVMERAVRSPPASSSPCWAAQVSQSLLTLHVYQLHHQLCCFPLFLLFLWTLSGTLISFLYSGGQNCTHYSRWGCTSA